MERNSANQPEKIAQTQSLPPSVIMSVEPAFDNALRLHQLGRLNEAEQAYREVLQIEPNHPGAQHLLGVIRHQRGDHETAVKLINRAIAINPTKAVYRNNYGAALYSLGRYAEAQESFHRALELRPQYADALSNLGMVEAALGEEEAALASYRKALELEPRHQDTLKRLTTLLEKIGRGEEAIAIFEAAAATCPTASLFTEFGSLLVTMRRTRQAIGAFQRALAIEPNHANAHFQLGNAYQGLHHIEEAVGHFDRAARLCPTKPLWGLRRLGCCPAVFSSSDELDVYRQKLGRELDLAMDAIGPAAGWNDILAAAAFPGVAFAYHGRNNRSLKEKFAALYEPYFRNQPIPKGSQLQDRRRIGIVVTRGHEGIFLRCMRGVLEQLDPKRFELVVCCSNGIARLLRNGICRENLRFVTFSTMLTEAAARILEAACDVIHFWEIGSDPLNYFLPFARLAPVQTTSWGSQITTGVPTVDWFLSSELIESEFSKNQYSERLWKSKTLFINTSRLPPVSSVGRDYFRLPENRTLYVCFQNPLKIHPDMDALLHGILESDTRAAIVLLAERHGYTAGLLKQRFMRTIPYHHERIIFLPRLEFEDYCRLLQLADAVLDPPHYSAGSSAYDIFSFHQPIVTMRGELAVGRLTAGLYQKMNIRDLIATSPANYIDTALRLANDRDWRMGLRERIAEGGEAIFDEAEVVREHERFFTEVLAIIDR